MTNSDESNNEEDIKKCNPQDHIKSAARERRQGFLLSDVNLDDDDNEKCNRKE